MKKMRMVKILMVLTLVIASISFARVRTGSGRKNTRPKTGKTGDATTRICVDLSGILYECYDDVAAPEMAY